MPASCVTTNPQNLPTVNVLLGPFIENNMNVFRCPMDQYPGGGTYFDKVGLSYDYPAGTYANLSLPRSPEAARGPPRPCT